MSIGQLSSGSSFPCLSVTSVVETAAFVGADGSTETRPELSDLLSSQMSMGQPDASPLSESQKGATRRLYPPSRFRFTTTRKPPGLSW